eukprot:3476129-Lingulodinium_polyedra.AAC.1
MDSTAAAGLGPCMATPRHCAKCWVGHGRCINMFMEEENALTSLSLSRAEENTSSNSSIEQEWSLTTHQCAGSAGHLSQWYAVALPAVGDWKKKEKNLTLSPEHPHQHQHQHHHHHRHHHHHMHQHGQQQQQQQ